ncbi:MAG: hypothetical protein ACOYZ6_08045 [Chloroflexota bacterium]
MKHTTVRQAKEDALKEYERKQAEIKKLLKQIEVGLEKHDREASGQGGHHWGHVGDLTHVADQLQDLRDFLTDKGDYAS